MLDSTIHTMVEVLDNLKSEIIGTRIMMIGQADFLINLNTFDFQFTCSEAVLTFLSLFQRAIGNGVLTNAARSLQISVT